MNSRGRWCTVLLLCLAMCYWGNSVASASEPQKARTKEDTNNEVVRTYAQVYIEQKDYASAEALIANYLVTEGRDQGLWNLLGLTQLSQKKFAQACFAFKKASELSASSLDQVISYYNFADCLNRGGRQEEAIGVLKQIQTKYPDFSEFSDSIIAQIQNGTISKISALPALKQRPRGKFRVFGALGVGYDTNVTLIQDSLIGSTAVSDHASPYVTPALQVGYLGQAWVKTLDTRYLTTFTDYSAASAKSFNGLYQRVDAVLGSSEFRYGVIGETYFLNRNPFQLYFWDLGLTFIKTKRVSDSEIWEFEVPIRYQGYLLDLDASGADNVRTGEDLQLKATYRNFTSENRYALAQFALENQLSQGKNYRFTGLTIPVTYATLIPFFESFRLSNTFNAEVSTQWYWSADPSRKDLSGKLGTGLMKVFDGNWTLAFDVYYKKVISTLPLARYGKGVISLMLSHEFI